MREDFISSLVCCDDRGELSLDSVAERSHDEILSGALVCHTCRRRYTIEHGVPVVMNNPPPEEAPVHFGEQWTWFLEGKFEDPTTSSLGESREFIVADFFDLTGLTPETLHGKRILDAGSGASKIAYHLTQSFPDIPFEIVSLELTHAVYAAFNLRNEPRTRFVRASVFEPPLRRESFDVVYSAGVLHHTPDPRRAFNALVPLVKPAGTMSTWMYSKKFNPFLDVTGLLWPITRHLPPQLTLIIAHMLSLPFWVLFRLGSAYKALFRPSSWRWKWVMPLSLPAIRLHLFDYMHTYYRFRYWPDEIVPWYEENGLLDIRVLRPGSTAIHARAPSRKCSATVAGAL